MIPPTREQLRAFNDTELEASLNVAHHTFGIFLRLGLPDAMRALMNLAIDMTVEVHTRNSTPSQPQFVSVPSGSMQ